MNLPDWLSAFVVLSSSISVWAQCSSQQATVTALQSKVQSDESAIRRLSPAMQTASLQDWAVAADEQKRRILTESLHDGINSILSYDLDKSAAYVEAKALQPTVIEGVNLPNGVASIGAPQRNAIISRMELQGLGDTVQGRGIIELIRQAGSTSNKAQKIAILSRVPGVLPDYHDLINSESGLDTAAVAFQIAAGLIGRGDFAVAVEIALFKGVQNLLDAYVISKSVGSLSASTENTLKAINARNVPLKDHIAQLQQAKTALGNCLSTSRTASSPATPANRVDPNADYESRRSALLDQAKKDTDAMSGCVIAQGRCANACGGGPLSCNVACNNAEDACFAPLKNDWDNVMQIYYNLGAQHNAPKPPN
jgi:hypothetical protein